MSKQKAVKWLKGARQPVLVTVLLLLICGGLFPLVLTGLGGLIFPNQAQGSPVAGADGETTGFYFVGQDFTQDYFMKGRPSAYHYNTYYEDAEGKLLYNDGSEYAGLSSGSYNYGASNPALTERISADIAAFQAENPDIPKEEIPGELFTASGSGLDPHISTASALIQLPGIAKASGISEERLQEIVKQNTKGKVLGVFGEERVHVLGVNMDIAEEMGLNAEKQ